MSDLKSDRIGGTDESKDLCAHRYTHTKTETYTLTRARFHTHSHTHTHTHTHTRMHVVEANSFARQGGLKAALSKKKKKDSLPKTNL